MSKPKAPNESLFPVVPIVHIVRPFNRFLHIEAASGVILLLATITALYLANSAWSEEFLNFWEIHVRLEVNSNSFVFDHSLKHLINDGLMVIFFFVIGMEVKRELVLGELRDLRRAALPIAAALGGMLVPAGIYLALQWGQPAQRGWGIPMATDIAFVVGCMTLLGSWVPLGLRVMLLSLAIADDLGAILVIAIGYSSELEFNWLWVGLAGIGLVYLLAYLGVRSRLIYVLVGVGIWYCFHESGVHATIAGVIIGFLTPARSYLKPAIFQKIMETVDQIFSGDWEDASERASKLREIQKAASETISPLEQLLNLLHPWVSFVIMPLFALANAGVPFQVSDVTGSVALAVMLGLLVGKPVGIFLFSWLSIKAGIASLPSGVGWSKLLGGACLAGIGFTMALFIAELALEGPDLNMAKIGVLVGSLFSAILGMSLLVLFGILEKFKKRESGSPEAAGG